MLTYAWVSVILYPYFHNVINEQNTAHCSGLFFVIFLKYCRCALLENYLYYYK